MASKRYYEEKKQERKDGGMIGSSGGIANMPQDVKYHAWPTAGTYLNETHDDTIKDIDQQINENNSGMKKKLDPHKW